MHYQVLGIVSFSILCPILEVVTLGFAVDVHALMVTPTQSILWVWYGAGLRFLRVKFGCSLATLFPMFQ